MRVFRLAAVPLVIVSLTATTLATWSASGGAAEPPPIIMSNPRPLVHVAPGGSFTFRASAKDAATVLWVVKAPDGSSVGTYSGDSTMTKKGVLKSSFTFGPFNASENGLEVGAGFANDPTGVPSGIQVSGTSFGVVVLTKAPKG